MDYRHGEHMENENPRTLQTFKVFTLCKSQFFMGIHEFPMSSLAFMVFPWTFISFLRETHEKMLRGNCLGRGKCPVTEESRWCSVSHEARDIT